MAHLNAKSSWKDELWNVSLLPTVQISAGATPPHGPGPSGGSALPVPALLSVVEVTTAPAWRAAA